MKQVLVNLNDHIEEDDEPLAMGFDEQYERMIKKQLGGLLAEYIDFSLGQMPGKTKQASNMMETLKEFKNKFP